MKKEVYILIHDTNNQIGELKSSIYWLRKEFAKKEGLSEEEFSKAVG
jgi:hypothetical protein